MTATQHGERPGDTTMAHTHTCLSCGDELETGDFDCESDSDHPYQLCHECQTAGYDPNAGGEQL